MTRKLLPIKVSNNTHDQFLLAFPLIFLLQVIVRVQEKHFFLLSKIKPWTEIETLEGFILTSRNGGISLHLNQDEISKTALPEAKSSGD